MPRTLEQGSLLQSNPRRLIFEHVRRTPGAHLRQLERDLRLPLGTLEYHLYRLERGGLVDARRFSRYKTFFCVSEIGRTDKEALYLLRQEMPRRIAEEILNAGALSFQGLGSRMPISPSTISYHLRRLIAGGLIVETRLGRQKFFRVTNPATLGRLLEVSSGSVAAPERGIAFRPAFHLRSPRPGRGRAIREGRRELGWVVGQ